jgi:hypothetical protein
MRTTSADSPRIFHRAVQRVAVILAFALCVFAPRSAAALPVLIVDDFEDGTTENWFAGGGPFGQTPPNSPINIPSGGPTGAGDAYLQIQSHGRSGPGNRPVAMNATQWAMDYLAGGVTTIEMDIRNSGNTDLFLRLLFEDPIPGPPVNVAASVVPIFVPSGGGWTHIVFPILPADLIALAGSVPGALANATILRLFHDPPPVTEFPGPAIAAIVDVDNISATVNVVPEPSALLLLFTGVALVARRRRTTPRD